MGGKGRWLIKKGYAYIGIVNVLAGQPAGIGAINGREKTVRMMKDAKNTEYVRTAMELWGSVKRTKKLREVNFDERD